MPEVPQFDDPAPEHMFLASRNGLRTYGELDTFKKFFLQFLIDYDLKPGRPIGFLSDSNDELIFAIAACWQLGIPIVCLNPLSTESEIEKQLNRLKPDVVFVDEDHKQLLPPGLQIPIEHLNLKRVFSRDHNYSLLARNYKPDLDPDRVFGYFFTSGTTGEPKIVPLKRRQMLFAAQASKDNFQPRENHFWLLCLPLNHVGGIAIVIRSLLYRSAIYRMNRFDQQAVATFLSENNLFQAASLVPTMLERLLKIPAFQTHRNFKAILLGGGPVDTDLLRTCVRKGIPLISSYGMTETCAQIAANPVLKPDALYNPLKSVGKIFKPNEVEIRDESGQKVSANNSGLIWLRGPQVFDGYYNDENNEEVFDDQGWFNTGDVGHLNARKQLFVEARRTDVIITGGENVSPFEVESELTKIASVSEAAVLGLPDKEWGQRIVAVVVTDSEETIQTEQIVEQLKKKISAYKIPKEIVQVRELPKTQSGKVIKGQLLPYFK